MAISKSGKDQEFQKNFPFISCIKCNEEEYIGIILNLDGNVTSIYDYSIIRSEFEKQKFLELGDVWWWESNRKIPINIFLKAEMIYYRPYIKTFNSKDVTLMFGPTVNLGEIAEKRIKRKSIQLVRTPKKTRS
jgi:hypothetical protein